MYIIAEHGIAAFRSLPKMKTANQHGIFDFFLFATFLNDKFLEAQWISSIIYVREWVNDTN